MSDLGWFGSSWYDHRQNRRIDELSDQLWSQRSEAWRLKSQISKLQGDLGQRVNRLATAFDAFVELSDLREELRAFQPAAVARRHARQVLRRLAARRGDGSSGLPDQLTLPPVDGATAEMFGYWLPSALTGLVATLRGDGGTAEAELASARDLDATRTGLFLCLALLLTGHVEQAAVHLPGVLDLAADRRVSRAQRALWLAAVDGRFGDRGRAAVGDRLAALVSGLPEAVRATEVAAWRGVVDRLSTRRPQVPAMPRAVEPPAGFLPQIQAANGLEALANWCAQASVTAPPDDRPQPDGDRRSDGDAGSADPLVALLWELVDEGAPEEQPLLDRVAELRRVVQPERAEPRYGRAPWHSPIDTPLALLRSDVAADHAGRRAVAIRAAAPLLAAVADELVARARQTPPDPAEVRFGRHVVRYGPLGAEPASLAAAQEATLAPPPAPGGAGTTVGGGLLVAAVVLLGLGIAFGAAGWGVLLGGLAAAVGGWLVYDGVQARRDHELAVDRRRSDWARLEEQIEQAATAVAELRTRTRQAADDATATRARLTQILAAPPTAPTPPTSPTSPTAAAG